MRKYLLILPVLLLILAATPACVHEEEPRLQALGRGDTLPSFSVTTIDGDVFSADSFRGRKGAIVFFSTKCKDCIKALPELEESYRRFCETPAAEDFVLICISREETEASVMSFWEEHDLTMPVAVETDRSIYSLFASAGIPRMFAVDDCTITASYLEKIPPDALEKAAQ